MRTTSDRHGHHEPGHPLQHIRQLSDITPYNVIYPSEGSAIRSLADNLLIANGVGELPHRVETVSGIYGRVLTKSTDAVWFISEGVVATELAVGELRALPFNMQTTAGPVGIIMRRDDEISPDIRTFSRIAQHVAGKINALPAT